MSPSRERMVQQEYWKEHTSTLDGATVNAMMLDSQVTDFLIFVFFLSYTAHIFPSRKFLIIHHATRVDFCHLHSPCLCIW